MKSLIHNVGFTLAISFFVMAQAGGVAAQTSRAAATSMNLSANGVSVKVPIARNWAEAPNPARGSRVLLYAGAVQSTGPSWLRTAAITVTTENRKDHAEALARLKEIEAEEKAPVAYLVVGGWPALQRRQLTPLPVPGASNQEIMQATRITTAIAAGKVVVRLEALIPPGADLQIADEAQAISQTVTFSVAGDPLTVDSEVQSLQSQPAPTAPAVPLSGPESSAPTLRSGAAEVQGSPGQIPLAQVPAPSVPSFGLAQQIMVGQGELEVAVSANGKNIVVAKNFGTAFSNDGGQTFNPVPGSSPNDPSLAVGVSGAFYLGSIGSAPGSNTTAIFVSTNNGQTFPFRANAVICPTNGVGSCFADQEHIAADRVNIAPGGGDQVYSTWRNFATPFSLQIVCSTNGGFNWTAPVNVANNDFPRIAVGQDGFVYVVYRAGGNIMLQKFSSCANGLTVQPGFPKTVVAGIPSVPCPVPGLDRCNDGNDLVSHTVAVDDMDPNHIYVAYALNTSTSPTNENIIVRDSLDGGVTWMAARAVRVNSPVPARRYMPWVCAVGGVARVSWYDRRVAASSLDNSMTDFYSGSASLDGNGNLVAGTEFKVSPVPDSNCAAGWPCAPRSMADSESCSIQPQLAGVCSNTATRCDFSAPNCAPMVACLTGGGCPKYGDYNGIACAAGRVFNAWTSATNPQGIQTGLAVYFASKVVCCVPQIQVPGSVALADTCVGATNFATLTVCNTGKELLEVGTITSSNPQISVVTPSSGYPVVISPDFCFPFQVRYAPNSVGQLSATLTVPSDDPVNPSVPVQVIANASQQKLATAVADGGRFGDVCLGSFKDLDLTIANSGGCDLFINNITSSSPEFIVPAVVAFPLRILGGTAVHLPIRLTPTSLGPKLGSITITHNDPTQGPRVIMLSGNTPPGDVRVTGSLGFGNVCAETTAEKSISICNVGKCNLTVSSVSLGACVDFIIVNNPFPATVSPDSCVSVTVRYTPTSCGPHTCTLTITTDDPDTPVINLPVTANTPCPEIDVSPDVCFAPTVIQSVGACSTLVPFPISNKGQCNLKITAITLGGANANAYALVAVPSFPIIVQPGHVAGDGALKIAFKPLLLARDTLATISVTYESDPITHTTVTETRTLNGEGVRTGARVLVLGNGVPVAQVEKLQIQRINANRNKNLLDTVETAMNLQLQTFVPAAPCAPFQYHREYSTVSNPIQLLPGSYQITATAIVDGKRRTKTIGFDVNTCTFNPNIVISLP